uniref:Uncharacterized protein n=1 Tax=Arundo donax TaxID=35708 RepID=A0A0A9GNV3_ARUDO
MLIDFIVEYTWNQMSLVRMICILFTFKIVHWCIANLVIQNPGLCYCMWISF